MFVYVERLQHKEGMVFLSYMNNMKKGLLIHGDCKFFCNFAI